MRTCALLALAIAACTTSSSSSTDGGGTSMGGASLSIASVETPGLVGESAPPDGTTFILIDLTLKNTASATPLATLPTMFTLYTDHQLVLMAPVLEGAVAMACTGTASIAQGGSLSCSMLYEVPNGQKPTALHYDDGMGHASALDVPAPAMPADGCTTISGYQNVDGADCESCVPQDCMTQLQAQANMCTSCSNACDNTGSVGATCTCTENCGGACWTASEALYDCVIDQCAASCR